MCSLLKKKKEEEEEIEGVQPESEGFRLNPDSHSLAGDLRQIT